MRDSVTRLALLAGLAVAMALQACAPEPKFAALDSGAAGDGGADVGGDGLAQDASATQGDGAATEDTLAVDGQSADTGDGALSDAVTQTGCSSDQDCIQALGLGPCEYARCTAGKCESFKAAEGKPCGQAECLSEGGMLTLSARLCTAGVCGAKVVQLACDDGDACTQELCNGSAGCGHTAIACADQEPCTADACDKASGCTHLPSAATACDDGNACTKGDVCANGACKPGFAIDCPGLSDCVGQVCQPASGSCAPVNSADGQACDDGNPCSQSDACKSGACLGLNNPCDDNNPCTFDGCSGGNCQHTAGPGKCDVDASACTADECVQGLCQGGAALGCDDNNPCTIDSCDAKKGCLHPPAAFALPCDVNKWCGQGAQAAACVPVVSPAQMAWVPGGPVKLGCSASDTFCNPDEKPAHTVQVASYFIGKAEVTVEQYGQCVAGGACTLPGSGAAATYGVAGKGKYPVNYVTWSQAASYCLWSGGGRLCTEAEWEMAARGPDQRRFPWGNTPGAACEFANWGGSCGGIQAVGQYPKGDSPFGLQDAAGNLREWVSDWYGSTYYAELAKQGEVATAPAGPASGPGRVVRGGYFQDNAPEIRTSARAFAPPASSTSGIGIRCCRTPK